MNDPVIQLAGLTRSFEQGGERIDVLRGVDLTVAPGEIVALLGPSGSGKSTLLQAVGLLEGGFGGSIRLAGVEATRLSADERTVLRRDRIGFVYQFHHLLPEFTALENVCMPLLIGRTPIAEARQRATTLLERVGLGHRLSHKPAELSGGERQRVAIARALVNNPRLVLADEPTGNLDARNADSIFQLLGELNASQGTAFLVVTHDLQLAKRMGRQLEMRDGHLNAELTLMGAE